MLFFSVLHETQLSSPLHIGKLWKHSSHHPFTIFIHQNDKHKRKKKGKDV